MKIHNCLPILIDCLNRWTTRPTAAQFEDGYVEPTREAAGDFFDDFYDVIKSLDWDRYRNHALKIDPAREEARLRGHIDDMERLFGFDLEGEVCLFGSFETWDGFARFDRGRHRVYLGIDESFDNGKYIDILTVHELTHAARETRAEVWQADGLDPLMERHVYLENQTVIEHLLGEGFSCLISEILVPGEHPSKYCYQTPESLDQIYASVAKIDRAVKSEITAHNGDYGDLYAIRPRYSHYYWAWQWAKNVMKERANNDPKILVKMGSRALTEHALQFTLQPN